MPFESRVSRGGGCSEGGGMDIFESLRLGALANQELDTALTAEQKSSMIDTATLKLAELLEQVARMVVK